MKTKPALTVPEKKFLKALRTLERRRQPATYRSISKECGWKSVQMAFQTKEGLESKGLLKVGTRLAFVEGPIITPMGVALLLAA